MNINKTTIQDISNLKEFGMVVLGAGKPLNEWVEGISKILKEEKIVEQDVNTFSGAATVEGNILGKNGRTDLLLVFNKNSKPNIGKLAIWRLRFGDISWTEDFVTNYRKDYL